MLPKGLNIDANNDLYIKRAAVHTRLLVRRYKDKIKFWQIENEPNWCKMHFIGGWRSGFTWTDPHDFKRKLLKELNNAVHSEDPKAQTIINLEADAKNINVNLYAPFCDFLGLDFYANYKSALPIDTSVFRRGKEFAKEAGKLLIIIETGYPSGPFFLRYSELRQTEYVTQACSDAYELDVFNGIGIWRYRDTSWRSFPFQDNYFGLFDTKSDPKPAWVYLAETAKRIL
ncbi:MAG: hypothetical protein NWE86_07800 [Candidatus Bathyarchaeota archaeon]|nr:hypothetical protein [Candidatus Bathyarchaeota archaeon]